MAYKARKRKVNKDFFIAYRLLKFSIFIIFSHSSITNFLDRLIAGLDEWQIDELLLKL